MAKKPAKEAPISSPEPERWIGMAEAAAFLGFTPAGLYLRLYKGQEIPHRKMGREFRFQKSSLQAWLDSNPKPLRTDRVASRRQAPATERHS